MSKFTKKMPITVILLGFSYLIAACGIGLGSLWMVSKSTDSGYFIYGLLVLMGGLFLSVLVRMFADIGQILFDTRVDLQNSFSQVNQQAQELKSQLALQADTLEEKLEAIIKNSGQSFQEKSKLDQKLSQELKAQLELQTTTLKEKLEAVISILNQSSQEKIKLDQVQGQELKAQLALQATTLKEKLEAVIYNFEAVISSLNQSSGEVKELSQKFAAIKDNFNQMNCDSKDMNQNIYQIRTFFEQIQKHLDLKK